MRAVVLSLALVAAVLTAGPAHAAATGERLVIDRIGVNAPVTSVGQRGGALDIGHNLWTAYRWRAGVKPCQPGSVAFAVHAYEVPDGRALGNRVKSLRRGDRITIARPGRDCTYRVTTSRVVRAGQSLRGCYSFDGPARGCIITCEGRVGPGRYTHRRVVRFAIVGRQ